MPRSELGKINKIQSPSFFESPCGGELRCGSSRPCSRLNKLLDTIPYLPLAVTRERSSRRIDGGYAYTDASACGNPQASSRPTREKQACRQEAVLSCAARKQRRRQVGHVIPIASPTCIWPDAGARPPNRDPASSESTGSPSVPHRSVSRRCHPLC
jgi:hypothetical protein